MVSVTLSIPPEVKKRMEAHPEINWSGFVRKAIEEKVESLSWREEMLEKIKGETSFDEWAVDFGRKIKKKAYGKAEKKKAA